MPEVIAPAAPATPSTPSAPAPAAPASSTPAPVTAPAPATPAAPVSNPSGELSTQDKLRAEWQEAKASVPLEEQNGSPAPAEEVAAPAAAEVTAQTPEEIAEAAAAETPAETPAPGETPAEVTAAEVPELDDGVSLGPQEFAKAIEADEATKKFFDDHPEIKGQVFGALRRDAENREIRQIVPDIETAKVMAQGAATWQSTDNLFLGATTKEGAGKFLDKWTQMAMYTDDQGQPVIENGQYKFHPALLSTFNHIFDNRLSVMREQAKSMPEETRERLLAALDILEEVNAPSSPALGEVPEDLKPYADSLKQREQVVTEKEKADRQADTQRKTEANTQSIERAETKAENSIVAQLQPKFKAAGLTEFEQNAAMVKIGQLVDQKLAESPYYQAALDSILSRAPGEAREKEHLAHLLKYTNQILGPIVAQVTREAKGGTLARQEVRQETRTRQTAASNTDPKTRSTTPAQPAPINNPQALITQIRTEWASAHPGEEMSREHLINEQMKRSGAFQART